MVHKFSNQKKGVLVLDDFAKLILARIDFVFGLFVKDVNEKPEPMIRADDLQRVATRYGEDLTCEEAKEMINFLDVDDSQVSKEEFAQLILMPPNEMKTLKVSPGTLTSTAATAAMIHFQESSMVRATQMPRTSVENLKQTETI